MLDVLPEQLYWAIFFVVGFAAIGIISAVRSVQRVASEEKILRSGTRAFSKLTQDSETLHGGPDTWLSTQPINSDSHFGDFVRLVWRSWLSGRSASLDELRSTARNREHASRSNGISRGVVALLLVVGIAGTLVAIKPILSEFQITVAATGETEQAAESAEKINLMINRLGTAFLPSLFALLSTVLVSVIRGFYLQRLSKLSRDLDKFALEELFPAFRSDSFSRDIQQMNSNLTTLNDRLQNRDKNFGDTVEKLSDLVKGFEKVAPALRAATKKIGAAEKSFKTTTKANIKDLTSVADEKATELQGLVERSANSMKDAVRESEKFFVNSASECETAVQTAMENGIEGVQRVLEDGESSIRSTLDSANEELITATTSGTDALKTATESASTEIADSIVKAEQVLVVPSEQITKGVKQIQKSNTDLQSDVASSLQNSESSIAVSLKQKEEEFSQALDKAKDSFNASLKQTNDNVGKAEESANRLERLSRDLVKDFDSLSDLLRSRQQFWKGVRKTLKIDSLFPRRFKKSAVTDD